MLPLPFALNHWNMRLHWTSGTTSHTCTSILSQNHYAEFIKHTKKHRQYKQHWGLHWQGAAAMYNHVPVFFLSISVEKKTCANCSLRCEHWQRGGVASNTMQGGPPAGGGPMHTQFFLFRAYAQSCHSAISMPCSRPETTVLNTCWYLATHQIIGSSSWDKQKEPRRAWTIYKFQQLSSSTTGGWGICNRVQERERERFVLILMWC